jgi:diguanylate cyclase (GGDEF)-like protein/excisionase family DNA binding protein
MDEIGTAAGDVRSQTSALIRARQDALAGDITAIISTLGDMLSPEEWHGCAELLLRLFAASVDAGSLDTESAAMRDLAHYSPPLTTRQLLDAVHHAERTIIDEVALDNRLGATSEPWALVAHAIRRATLEILGAHAEQIAGRDAPLQVRDPLTTLLVGPIFEVALAQEIERSLRHKHPLSLLLLDIDDLSQINREHGRGVGDRLLERTGILARQFFRTHDWVARLGEDAIAVLLPETTVDQAATLAGRFRQTVEQRLVLLDHKTDLTQIVTVSAAAVGTDLVQGDLNAAYVIAEAQAAVLRAKLNGRNRLEQVALQPTSFTIFGAAMMLGLSPRDVTRLVRDGTLRSARRGRHIHIDREVIEAVRKAAR